MPLIIKLTIGHQPIARELLPFEIGTALTAMMKRHLLDAVEVTNAWDSTVPIQVELYKTNIGKALLVPTSGRFARFSVSNRCDAVVWIIHRRCPFW